MGQEEILPGTLFMLVLCLLARKEQLHLSEIGNQIKLLSNGVLELSDGSLYPSLQQMSTKLWVTSKWGRTANNRRARYYRLTPKGRKQLEKELLRFERVTDAIARVIHPDYTE